MVLFFNLRFLREWLVQNRSFCQAHNMFHKKYLGSPAFYTCVYFSCLPRLSTLVIRLEASSSMCFTTVNAPYQLLFCGASKVIYARYLRYNSLNSYRIQFTFIDCHIVNLYNLFC